jgi:hypothetical protein
LIRGVTHHFRRWGLPGAGALVALAITTTVALPASAATNGQGVGVEYPAGVTSLKVCGDNQSKTWVCTTPFGVPASSAQPPYQTVWWVDGRSQPVSGSSAPSGNPQWWWVGTVEVLMYNSVGAAYQPIPCQVPQQQSSNWFRCVALNPKLSAPPPAPAPAPAPSPPPSQPPFGNLPPASAPAATVSGLSLSGSRHRLRNGQSVVLQGHVTGGSTSGLIVQLQALVPFPKPHWMLFGNAKVRPDGNFSYRYKFTRTFTRQRYAFRARVRPQLGYPGQTVRSPRVHVIVIG